MIFLIIILKKIINGKELVILFLLFKRYYHLFASSFYMITYNLLENVLYKKINDRSINTLEIMNEIYDYEYSNLGIDYIESFENQDLINYEKIEFIYG